jgi:hypothetical protein
MYSLVGTPLLFMVSVWALRAAMFSEMTWKGRQDQENDQEKDLLK